MIDSTSDWDANIPKHFVRYKGWLPACMEIKNQVGSTPIKYFTLCAKQAIDIFMLEKEKIIRRDDKNKLPNVIICEKIPSDAAEIYSLVRPPLKEAIIIGDLTKIMNSPELDTSNIENIKSRKQREENRNRKSYERLKGYFPFDIINLDPYGNFLAPPPDQNPLCGVLDKFLEIQELFLITPYDPPTRCK